MDGEVVAISELISSPHYRPVRRSDVRVSIDDPRRAREVLGFTAETTLVQGLRLTLQSSLPDQSNKI